MPDRPLDRRLDGFLRRGGLVRLAEDGDAYDVILNRVMAYIAARPEADEWPVSLGLRSLPPLAADWCDGHRQHDKCRDLGEIHEHPFRSASPEVALP